jgi:hypothetical protein
VKSAHRVNGRLHGVIGLQIEVPLMLGFADVALWTWRKYFADSTAAVAILRLRSFPIGGVRLATCPLSFECMSVESENFNKRLGRADLPPCIIQVPRRSAATFPKRDSGAGN